MRCKSRVATKWRRRFEKCPIGHYKASDGNVACKMCVNGTMQNNQGGISCVQCETNSVSVDTRDTCKPCTEPNTEPNAEKLIVFVLLELYETQMVLGAFINCPTGSILHENESKCIAVPGYIMVSGDNGDTFEKCPVNTYKSDT